jgi:hypothetical protein
MDNPWKIVSLIVTLLLLISVLFGFAGGYTLVAGPGSFSADTGSLAAAKTAVGYINTNMVASGDSATLLNVTEESGMYRVGVKLARTQQTASVYVTKDGKRLFLTYYDLTGRAASAQAARAPAKNCTSVVKQDTPRLQAFVVSYCPFGTQMQGILADIVAQVPALKSSITVRYIGEITDGTARSMHGTTEAAENLRQICIREEQSDKYWDYVSCFISSGSAEACMKSSGVANGTIASCTGDPARGLRYAADDFALAEKYGVSASPTLLLNNETVSEFDFGGRTPEIIKNMVCCGFTEKPGDCSITVNATRKAAVSGGSC